jgi:hypothetical protein
MRFYCLALVCLTLRASTAFQEETSDGVVLSPKGILRDATRPKGHRRVSWNLDSEHQTGTLEPDEEFESGLRPPHHRMYSRRYTGIRTSDEEDLVPRTPFHEMFGGLSDLDERVDPLMGKSSAFADDIGVFAELGCALYDELSNALATKKDSLLRGIKMRFVAAGRGTAAYAVRKVFGYELTDTDISKLDEVFSKPDWIPVAIDLLHQACASATTTTTGTPY